MLRSIFETLHRLVWLVLPPLVVFSFVALSLMRLDMSDNQAYVVAALTSGVFLFVVRYVYSSGRLSHAGGMFSWWPLPMVVILGLGVAIRLVWWWAFPMEPTSDAVTYLDLANRLISENTYAVGETRAYWPPGYPLFLYAVHLGFFEVTPSTVAIVNLSLYLASSYAIYALTQTVSGSTKVALAAAAMLAVWPNHVANIGVPYKEMLVFTALLWSVLFYARGRRLVGWFLSGLLLGLAVLVQPGAILFVSVYVVAGWYQRKRIDVLVGSLAAVILGLAVVVGPWTYRNYLLFDNFLLVSSNGGSNLYRANNELADGAFMMQGKVVLKGLNELEEDAAYKSLATDWILNNPVDFSVLAFRKMVLFLGDDSTGIYTSLKRATVDPVSGATYLFAKLVATAFWVFAWLIFYVKSERLRQLFREQPQTVLLSLSFLYFFVVHAVFESNGRYHFAATWAVIVLLALVVSRDEASSSGSPASGR